ncbi:tyrosine-type recombinase/integrase [Embleya sp. NPDC020886]|uniref:tyrosine-type recombinase/integrase n=1 Tax=Embleya sp. NPDC020886 TaxID=3363980 RepID=UPI0037ADA81D
MPTPSFDVRIWAVRNRNGRKTAEVRWRVGAEEFGSTHANKTMADGRRADLIAAINRGEPFDAESGLPMSEVRAIEAARTEVTWYAHARDFIEMKWPRSSAKRRMGLVVGLSTATVALTAKDAPSPDPKQLYQVLYLWGFNVHRWKQEPPAEAREMLAWVEANSLPVRSLERADSVRAVLGAMSVRLDGKRAAASTFINKRAVFRTAVGYAIEKERLDRNPLDKVSWERDDDDNQVEPACVVNPTQAHALLARVYAQGRRGRHLAAFFGCIYFAGMRCAEVVKLRTDQCTLPKRGWGELRPCKSGPRVGTAWTDSGDAHDDRGLKSRARSASRSIPIPPELVSMLRWHVYRYGTAPDGRLFRSAVGGLVQDKAYRLEWAKAREQVLTSAQVASPLAKRPYDLRHACVSLWLKSGVAPTEVARRAGQSVDVLLKVYAKCIDGTVKQDNDRISATLKAWKTPKS